MAIVTCTRTPFTSVLIKTYSAEWASLQDSDFRVRVRVGSWDGCRFAVSNWTPKKTFWDVSHSGKTTILPTLPPRQNMSHHFPPPSQSRFTFALRSVFPTFVGGEMNRLFSAWHIAVKQQGDQIGRFIGLWATFQSLRQQFICPSLPHS